MDKNGNESPGEGYFKKRMELMDAICFSVSQGNEFQTLRSIREWNELGIPGMIQDPLSEWKYELFSLMALLERTLRSAGIPLSVQGKLDSEYTARIHRAMDVGECQRLSEEMALDFCQEFSGKESPFYSTLVQSVLQIVDRDLAAPLTLRYLAKELNVNSSYLSSLFSREIGITLTEYVTRRRISYAANLLLTTQNPIKIVAKKAGIQDVQYFSRLFKRRMGVTPSQYRERSEKLS